MDFFEAEARAKKRTSRLVTLFVLAVAGTIAAGYFASVFLLAQANSRGHRHRYYDDSPSYGQSAPSLWQPRVFLAVTLGTLGVVGLASLFKSGRVIWIAPYRMIFPITRFSMNH